jgi:hypothetical protein
MAHPIVPSVGRKVWFYYDATQDRPFDATIIAVDGDKPDSRVTVYVIDDGGSVSVHKGLTAGDDKTRGVHYRWMPYQQDQAAKAAAAEAAEPAAKPNKSLPPPIAA